RAILGHMQYLSQRLAAEPSKAREEAQPRGPLAGGQRERILDATERLVAEKGAAGATIEAIVKAAGGSSVTFYQHLRDKEECFVAAFDRALGELRAEVVAAVAGEETRTDRVRVGLAALLAAVDADPERARLCFVEAQKGGRQVSARYDEALDAAADEL